MTERRALIDRQDSLPVTRQCHLLELNRSTAYYQPRAVSDEDLALMRLIDKIHLARPFLGTRRVRDELQDRGQIVNRKRVRRLMRLIQSARRKPMTERRALIDRQDSLPVTRQCHLLELNRSTAYYQPRAVSDEDLALMRLIDKIHLARPFLGTRRVRDELQDRGQIVNRKRVRRLMRLMGLRALYPKPRTSAPGTGHVIYPYRLKDLTIDRPNQVWAADISYSAPSLRRHQGRCCRSAGMSGIH